MWAALPFPPFVGERGRGIEGLLLATELLLAIASLLLPRLATRLRERRLTPVTTRLPHLIGNVQTSSRAASGFQANEVGGILVLLWPLLVAYTFAAGGRWWQRALLGAGALFAGTVMALTLSRSTYLGAAFAVVVLLVLRLPRLAPVTVGLAVAAALSVVAGLGVDRVLDLVLATDAGQAAIAGSSWQARLEIWTRAFYILQDFPFTGAGLNTLPVVVDTLYPLFLAGPNARVSHAHNLFLQTGVDLGLPGLLAFLWLLALTFRCWWRAWRRITGAAQRAILAGLLAGLAGHLVYGLTDAVTLGAKPGYLLWMVIATIVAAGRSPSLSRPLSPTKGGKGSWSSWDPRLPGPATGAPDTTIPPLHPSGKGVRG
ncbi:MAG: O-antigen ligase family protein [Chloroflexi bacterium]|nr:O-antigen ligase family protein [Chloroflexota bacterium]